MKTPLAIALNTALKLVALFGLLGLCVVIGPRAEAVQQVTTVTTPWIRANYSMDHMRLDPKGRFLAFTSLPGQPLAGLSVLDLKTHDIFEVTRQPVGLSFFWAPDGFRLFYREMYKKAGAKKDDEVRSVISAYDAALHQSVVLDELPFPTGILTFDPRDLRLHLMSMAGVHTKRISFPDERLARWQVARRTEDGKFVVTQNGVIWMTQGGTVLRRLEDDNSTIESFDISPDGTTIAWATSKGRIYTSKTGATPVFLAHGRDPRWHPENAQLLFAGSRMVGDKATSYDLKIADMKGASRFITKTPFVDERWPQWGGKKTGPAEHIVYTISKTTDVYLLEFKQ